MTSVRQVILAVVTVVAIIVFAIGARVLIPYYSQKPDEKLRRVHGEQAECIRKALDAFVREDANSKLPANLFEITNILTTLGGNVVHETNVSEVIGRFEYFTPPLPFKGEQIILVEKPHHYRRHHGGFVVWSNGVVRFYWEDDFEQLQMTILTRKRSP